MIKSFKHKGLEKFFYSGNKKGIDAIHIRKLGRILDRLDASVKPQDMDLPGYNLHQLKGKEKGIWSVWVSGNWRITFKLDDTDAIDVNYFDYH